MADVGDDLLDGDLDETAFGDLDGEEEDALLADDEYDSYQNARQAVFSESSQQQERHSELFHMVNQVQDVSEGDEILEDGEEDVLELAVVDELDESELDNGQGNSQAWAENSRAVEADSGRGEPSSRGGGSSSRGGVSSSTNTISALGVESDEEETDGRGSRFKTERTNIISLKGVIGKSLSDIPDSLDNVKTAVPSSGMRHRGSMQRGGRGNIRGRLGPIQQGGVMVRGGFNPVRRPNMLPSSHHQPPPSHKIHVNPHFRGGMHQSQPIWDNERLPPPPGCETYASSIPHTKLQEGSWGVPPPQHMGRSPPFSQQHPGHLGQYQNPQMYPPPLQQSQGYEEQYRPMMEPPQQNQPNRIVQFSENTQLITVENQHFQRPTFDQNTKSFQSLQNNNQFQPTQNNNHFQPPQNAPPHFNNSVFPNQFSNSPPRPNFQSQPFPTQNPPPNFMNYPSNEFNSPTNPPIFPNFDNNQNSWTSPPQPIVNQQNQFYPPGQSAPVFCSPQQPQPQFPPPHPPFQNQQPNFRPPQQKQFQGNMRGGIKRLSPRQSLSTSASTAKQMRFDNNKQKKTIVNIRSNLQEIKTVDNLPDTTTAQEPEPEIEEDEETKQYRMKIAEQKALREIILKEKEARRLAAIIEKQRKQENSTNTMAKAVSVPQPPPQPQQVGRGQGRRRNNAGNRMTSKQQPKQQPKQTQQLQVPGAPVVQIQQMLGTMYKIVKVRTKEGAIVTRKTPLVMNPAGTAATPMRTVSQAQRRVVLNNPQQASVRMTNTANRGRMPQGGNTVRMVSAKQIQGRTLFTVQTTPQNAPRMQPPQRVVIDKRLANSTITVAVTPTIPVSTLVTIDNLSLSTSQAQLQKLAKQVGSLVSFKHEPDLKRATLKFQKPKEAEQFYLKFHRKMIDLSRICVNVVPE